MEYKFDIIQENDYLDIYRITEGVLLKVYKVKIIQPEYGYVAERKGVAKKLFKGCYKLIKPVATPWRNLEPGTIILERYIVESTEPKNYKYEIKTTGNALGGSVSDISTYLDTINHLIDKTRNPMMYEWQNKNPKYMQGKSNNE